MRIFVLLTLVLGIAGLIWFLSTGGPESARELGPAHGRLGEPGSSGQVLDGQNEQGEDLAELAVSDGRELAQPDAEADAGEWNDGAFRLVTGIVLDTYADKSIPGASVTLTFPVSREYNSLDVERSRDFEAIGDTVTDEHGRFALRAPQDLALDLAIFKEGYAKHQQSFVFAGSEHEVRLQPGAILRGRITSEETGEPLEGIQLQCVKGRGLVVIEEQTDAGGNYQFLGLSGETYTLIVKPKVHQSPGWQQVELVPGRVRELDMELKPGIAIFGTVTAKETGAPIAGAEIGEAWVFFRSVFTDAQGRYRMEGFGSPGMQDVHVRADGYGKDQWDFRKSGRRGNGLPTEDTELDFALEKANGAFGKVTDVDGRPMEGVYCAAIASKRIKGVQHADYESVDSNAAGEFSFTSLNPKLRHQVQLRLRGFGTRTYDFPRSETGKVDLGTIVLRPGGTVRGKLVDETGAAISGQEIQLVGTNADAAEIGRRGSKIQTSSYAGERNSKTRSDGAFSFADVAGGTYSVKTYLRGRFTNETSQEVTIKDGQVLDGVVLVLQRGSSIRGRLLGPGGEGVEGAYINVLDAAGNPVPSITAKTGKAGAFQVVGLEEGDYQLGGSCVYYNRYHAGPPLVGGPLVSASTGATDVILLAEEAAKLSVRLLDRKGNPVLDGHVTVNGAHSGLFMGSGYSDANGHFECWVRQGVGYDVTWFTQFRRRAQEGDVAFSGVPDAKAILKAVVAGPQSHILQAH